MSTISFVPASGAGEAELLNQSVHAAFFDPHSRHAILFLVIRACASRLRENVGLYGSCSPSERAFEWFSAVSTALHRVAAGALGTVGISAAVPIFCRMIERTALLLRPEPFSAPYFCAT